MIHHRTTPSGVPIIFEDGLDGKRRTYWLHEQTPQAKVPSITTVLGVIHKEGMLYAVEKIAMEGAIELATSTGLPSNLDDAMRAYKDRGLSFRAVWNQKADKGTDIHDWFEKILVDPGARLPDDCQMFATGIRRWLDEYEVEPVESEVMVCSERHGFAGRFDLLALVDGERTRVELKSTGGLPRSADGMVKPPYDTYLWQLAAQELAAVESGDPPARHHAVLRVDEEGDFDFHITGVQDPAGFLACLSVYRQLRGLPEPQQQLSILEEAV